ncbi:MAG: Cell wall surface anchored protein, partial [Parcubacteria group bacterium GW2011_GWF2_44_8b]
MLMVNPIFSDGKEYISAVRAAEKIGYASDYISQLCRAKKIPGQLIGKSWYVDFASLVEYKKNRQLGKTKKSLVSGPKGQTLGIQKGLTLENLEKSLPIILSQPSSETTAGEARSLDNPVFTYENDDRPRLPELSKKSCYIEPTWTSTLVGRAVALSLVLLIAIGTGFATLEHTNQRVAMEVREKTETLTNIPKEFLSALVQSRALDTFAHSELATVSFFDGVGKLFDSVVSSFQYLKQIALDNFFFSVTPPQLTYTAPVTPSPPSRALTTSASSINLESLKSELKTELESYVRAEIGALRPLVVYTSSPSVAATDFESFRVNEVIPITYNIVTRQSDSDSGRLSSIISNLTTNGIFENITVTGTCTGCGDGAQTPWTSNIDGAGFSLANAGSLTFTNFSATSTSATSTISTGGFAVGTNQFVVQQSTGNVGIGTTSPSDALALNGAMYFASVSVPSVTSNRLYNAGGDLYWAGSVVGGSTTGTWASDGTNVWRAGGNVGIGTTSPYAKLSVVGGTSGTVIVADAITGFSGNLLDLKVASTTKFVINQNGDFIASGNSTTTNATTTNFAVSSIASSLLKTNAAGSLIAAIAGTDYVSGSSFFAFPWTQTTYGNSTSTTLGFLNGFLSTASSTINSSFKLPTLSSGGLGVDATGLVYSGATTTAGTGLTYSGNQFNVDLGTAIDISTETNLTGGLGLTLTDDDLACDTASSSVFGCLASADWTTFNNKLSTY